MQIIKEIETAKTNTLINKLNIIIIIYIVTFYYYYNFMNTKVIN